MGMIPTSALPLNQTQAEDVEHTLYQAVLSTTTPANLPATTIHPKLLSATVVGAAISLGCGLLSLFHISVPTDAEQSITVIASAVAGYLTPSK